MCDKGWGGDIREMESDFSPAAVFSILHKWHRKVYYLPCWFPINDDSSRDWLKSISQLLKKAVGDGKALSNQIRKDKIAERTMIKENNF